MLTHKLVWDSLSEGKGKWLWFLLWLGSGTKVEIPIYGFELQDLNYSPPPPPQQDRNARAFLLTCPDIGREGGMELKAVSGQASKINSVFLTFLTFKLPNC